MILLTYHLYGVGRSVLLPPSFHIPFPFLSLFLLPTSLGLYQETQVSPAGRLPPTLPQGVRAYFRHQHIGLWYPDELLALLACLAPFMSVSDELAASF